MSLPGPADAVVSDGGDRTPRRHHRPARYADLTELIDAAGGDDAPSSRAEIAAATAAVLVSAGRDAGSEESGPFVDLADRIGLDTLAALWRDAEPVSLPGALWALYVLRQWCRSNGEEVTRLWRAGEAAAPADAVVAGVPHYAQVDEVQRVADAVLAGAYRGDFAVALERAAALFRVVAAGRRRLAAETASGPDDGVGAPTGGRAAGVAGERHDDLALAERNERAAADLAAAAARWRAGTLH